MVLKKQLYRFTQAHWLFAVLALIFGFIFVMIIPPLWGLDEPAHFERVYQIAHGHILPNRSSKADYGGYAPANLVDLGNYTIGDLVDNKPEGVLSRKDIDDVNAYKQYVNAKFSSEQARSPGSSAYSPLAYPGPIVGVILADSVNVSIGKTLFLARFLSLIIYVLLIWIAIRLLRNSKFKWLFMVVALLPSALFQSAVISADSILIALSLLFVALFIVLTMADPENKFKKKRLLSALLVVAVVLPLIKVNYAFLSLSLIFLPVTIFRSKKLSIIIKSVTVIVMSVLAFLWSYVTNVTGDAPSSQRPDGAVISPHMQILSLIHNPINFIEASIRSVVVNGDMYTQTLVSQLGWNYVNLPIFVTILIFLGLAAAAIYAKKETIIIRKKLLLVVGLSIIGIVSIFGVFFVTFTPVGRNAVDGIQGRYFIPFLLPLLLVASSYIPTELKISSKNAKYVFGSIVLTSLIVSVCYYALATY